MTDREKILGRLLTPSKWDEVSSGCWEWRGALHKGYGRISTRINNKPIESPATRVALRRKLGRPIKPGLLACHTCDNTKCVNPEHLYEGTPKQNTADMMRRERHNNSFIKGGEATRKLTLGQVLDIRQRASKGQIYPPMAEEFGVSIQTISNAVSGKYYGFDRVDSRGVNAERWSRRSRRTLTWEQVQEIRERYGTGERQTDLEKEFNLSSGTVSRIVNYQIYKEDS